MINSILRLSLGVVMIAAASAVLLLTDKGSQRAGLNPSDTNAAGPQRVFSVALFQHVSQPIIEEGAKGVIAGLAAAGYQDGDTIRLRRFNAEGDAATSNTIALELVGGEYDLIVTLSTLSLQAVAAANRDAKVPHVFGMVSDPVAAGVGIARDDPMKHPPYMVGLGTMQPVAEAFRMARKLAPKLARVGVAWNPSEANSEACTKIARSVCLELGIELLEANVDNTAGVREAVASVIGRGAEAIWIGGDVTVLASIDSVIGPARSAGIPVFSNIPGCGARGTLFDLGADYYQVGGKVGELAGRVLGGESPASLPVLYEVPAELWINRVALENLKRG
jgi:putative tryptophan/tyrosine transport system substrate-binding protein